MVGSGGGGRSRIQFISVAVEHLLLDNSAKQGSWDDDLWRSVKANANKVPTKKR